MEGYLARHGLSHLAPAIAAHEVDLQTLLLLTEDDIECMFEGTAHTDAAARLTAAILSDAAPEAKEEDEKLFVDRGHFDLSDPRYAATFDRVARAIGAYD